LLSSMVFQAPATFAEDTLFSGRRYSKACTADPVA
jgi:hypothetical protein